MRLPARPRTGERCGGAALRRSRSCVVPGRRLRADRAALLHLPSQSTLYISPALRIGAADSMTNRREISKKKDLWWHMKCWIDAQKCPCDVATATSVLAAQHSFTFCTDSVSGIADNMSSTLVAMCLHPCVAFQHFRLKK